MSTDPRLTAVVSQYQLVLIKHGFICAVFIQRDASILLTGYGTYLGKFIMHICPANRRKHFWMLAMQTRNWGLWHQKQVSQQGYVIASHIKSWDVITNPCLRYPLLAPKSSIVLEIPHLTILSWCWWIQCACKFDPISFISRSWCTLYAAIFRCFWKSQNHSWGYSIKHISTDVYPPMHVWISKKNDLVVVFGVKFVFLRTTNKHSGHLQISGNTWSKPVKLTISILSCSSG